MLTYFHAGTPRPSDGSTRCPLTLQRLLEGDGQIVIKLMDFDGPLKWDDSLGGIVVSCIQLRHKDGFQIHENLLGAEGALLPAGYLPAT